MHANASEAATGPAEAMEKVDWHFSCVSVVSDIENPIIGTCAGLEANVVDVRAGSL